jgi:cytochrome c551/c552
MATFKQFDNSVHELSLSIAAAAEEKDRNKAIALYQRMLSGCFVCHAAYKDRVATVLSGAAGPE